MIYFDSDYLEGAHPAILAKLTETNLEQTPGYGNDKLRKRPRQNKSSLQLPASAGLFHFRRYADERHRNRHAAR